MHHHRAEHWLVVPGHRLTNPGKVPVEMIEVQSGAYLGEDDIVRFQDRYGRTQVAVG